MKKCYLLFCTLLFLHQEVLSHPEIAGIESSVSTATDGARDRRTPTASSYNSLSVASVHAVVVAVTGTVTDENGQGFPGVNIIVKGTSTGTTTDVNGRYALEVADDNATLVFSFVGYEEQEVAVSGRTVIDVQMKPNLQALDEVVVTALGIERSQKSLGYATTKVSSDELTINRTPNFMNALQGKVAGVSISALGTGPAGTSKIRIRGDRKSVV